MAFDYNPNTIWISHSSLSDFEKCPRLYYLRNIYRDKNLGNNFRIQVASPYLSLGEIVHDAIDNYTNRYNPLERNKDKMMYELSRGWILKKGKVGGFKSDSQEKEFKDAKYSCRVDDDGICDRYYLERLYDLISKDDKIGAVGGVVPLYGQPSFKRNVKLIKPIFNPSSVSSTILSISTLLMI